MRRAERKRREYRHARKLLGWSHPKMAQMLGKTERMSYRYAAGDVEIPDDIVMMVRRYVHDKLTLSSKRFEELMAQL